MQCFYMLSLYSDIKHFLEAIFFVVVQCNVILRHNVFKMFPFKHHIRHTQHKIISYLLEKKYIMNIGSKNANRKKEEQKWT